MRIEADRVPLIDFNLSLLTGASADAQTQSLDAEETAPVMTASISQRTRMCIHRLVHDLDACASKVSEKHPQQNEQYP